MTTNPFAIRWLLPALLLIFVAPAKAEYRTETEEKMVAAINQYRTTYKLPPLEVDPILMRVARDRAPYFTHRHDGRWMWDEAKRYGFKGFATDNLAQGYLTPKDAVRGWETSPMGHAMQMRGYFRMNGKWENRRFDRVGVARQGKNWIAIFGKLEPK